MGTAIQARHIAKCLDDGLNDKYCEFVKENYNYVVVENGMKWPQWEPKRDTFNTEKPDKGPSINGIINCPWPAPRIIFFIFV